MALSFGVLPPKQVYILSCMGFRILPYPIVVGKRFFHFFDGAINIFYYIVYSFLVQSTGKNVDMIIELLSTAAPPPSPSTPTDAQSTGGIPPSVCILPVV